MAQLDSIRKKLAGMLDTERLKHSENVVSCAAELASHWGVSKEKASIAGLLHDASRFMKPSEMLDKAKELGFPVGAVETSEPKLLHARLSAHIAKTEFGINDSEILQAIERHTIGAEDMSALDKIVYIADHIEPDRDFVGVERIRELALKDLDKGIVESTSAMIEALVKLGAPIHQGTVATRNYYLMRTKK